jgi:hypothetical protein
VPHVRTRGGVAWHGRQESERASKRMGREWFCHSIHIIMGVTLFYVGGGFIAGVSPVTAVSILLHPPTFSVL